MRLATCAVLSVITVLSACTVTMPDPTALSNDATSSRNLVDAQSAFETFDQVCLNTGPRFSGAIQTAAARGISTQQGRVGIDGIESFVSPTEQISMQLYRQRVESKLQTCKIFFAASAEQKNEIFASFAERFNLERQGNQLNPNIEGYGIPYEEDYVIRVSNSRLPPNIFALEAQSYHFLIDEES